MGRKRKETIGWKETVDLTEWGITNILAKADTGARRSAIDVKAIQELSDERVQFDIILHRKDRTETRTVVAPIAHRSRVRSSNGHVAERYFVTTRVQIGSIVKEVELSLVSRKAMVCRMLLGRAALAEDFLVDASHKYMTGPRRRVRALEDA